ncbi:UV DNA damage repair endonuclease UvsE [Evansella cellulosilytica]|uniref:UV-endonuclease UvdE n=1 Tax=Evansella cellulosilytica (strain ATCC 21833 / DSM 2522 / FERM P-1141 / JCM 9156 / N-4) TaxID=649639 RepID=E6TQI6_EVAC2|nr:UV DNA damage repair endonuclease UvsE [Evansella cellulosilytica]ADU30497.1 UV-endonuclease UvdE [Evansella cellulosilytica DSM 2522]
MLRIGYACINTTIPTKFRTCRLHTYEMKGEEIIKELTLHNLEQILMTLKWNVKHDIFFYRISTETIPLGSHEKMTWKWWIDEDILSLTNKIKVFKDRYNIRLSMHPGQYTVLSTPRENVLSRSLADLEYHDRLLQLVGGTDMIIHGGGQYGNMPEAKDRFIKNYSNLSSSIKSKLRLENDDRTYQLKDVLDISTMCNIPVCFDIHHHRCNNDNQPLKPMLKEVFSSWMNVDIPKVHISSGKTSVTDRSHHDYVFKEDFLHLLTIIEGIDVDIMVEAKMKEKAVLRIYDECFSQSK